MDIIININADIISVIAAGIALLPQEQGCHRTLIRDAFF